MSSSAPSVFNFAKLQGSSNFSAWFKRARAYLVFQTLWWVSVEVRPSEDEDTKAKLDRIPRHDSLDIPLYVRQQNWDIANSKAYASLQFFIEDQPLTQVEHITDLKELIAKLHDLYATKGFSARNHLFEELLSTTLQSTSSVQSYVDRLKDLDKQILGMGDRVPDWILVSILFRNLGSSWDIWTQQVIQNIRETSHSATFDTFVPQILDEDRRRSSKEETQALVSTSKSTGCTHCGKNHKSDSCWTKYPEKRKASPRCTSCNKQGHTEERCWTTNAQNKSSSSAMPAQNQNTPATDGGFAFMARKSPTTNDWILDSGASDCSKSNQ